MQLVLNVKDDYINEVLNILNSLKDVMIDTIHIDDNLTTQLNKLENYKNASYEEKKETYEEITQIQKALKTIELIKANKTETYPIEKLWDKLDD